MGKKESPDSKWPDYINALPEGQWVTLEKAGSYSRKQTAKQHGLEVRSHKIRGTELHHIEVRKPVGFPVLIEVRKPVSFPVLIEVRKPVGFPVLTETTIPDLLTRVERLEAQMEMLLLAASSARSIQ